jgi:hypothetical protein
MSNTSMRAALTLDSEKCSLAGGLRRDCALARSAHCASSRYLRYLRDKLAYSPLGLCNYLFRSRQRYHA